jgi:hypothetical protein
VAIKSLQNFLAGGFRIAIEQSFSFNDHAGYAVTALSGLLADERRLQRVRAPVAAQTFESGDFAVPQRT